MWCINHYLYTYNEGSQPTLPASCHAVTAAHIEAAEHAFLHGQDLVHVVQQLYGQLVELARVIVPDPYQGLLVY